MAEAVKELRRELCQGAAVEQAMRQEAEHEKTEMREEVKAMREQMLQMSEDNQKMREMMKHSEKKENTDEQSDPDHHPETVPPVVRRLAKGEGCDKRKARGYHEKTVW